MRHYEKIITSCVSTSATRMLIGAVSTVYMLVSGINLYEVGLIKSTQAILIFVLGFAVGILSDRIERKWLHITALIFSTFWLYFFYLAGLYKSFNLFLLAEILNAISLCVYQNNTNAYLVDQFYHEQPKGELSLALGKLGKWEFSLMAFSALLGGVLYSTLSENLFLLTTIIMSTVTVASFILLPKVSRRATHKTLPFIQKQDFLILIRKFSRYKQAIFLFVVLSLYFQIIIQYWQAVVYAINKSEQNGLILGVMLFSMFMVQSWAGKAIEAKYPISRLTLALSFLGSMALALLAEQWQSVLIYTIAICLALFVVRYTVIQTDIELHSHLLSRFRAKYDMLLNSLVRILTAVVLLIIGYISNLYGIQAIQIIGLIIAIIFTLFALITSQNVK